jgi:hypothetical protein
MLFQLENRRKRSLNHLIRAQEHVQGMRPHAAVVTNDGGFALPGAASPVVWQVFATAAIEHGNVVASRPAVGARVARLFAFGRIRIPIGLAVVGRNGARVLPDLGRAVRSSPRRVRAHSVVGRFICFRAGAHQLASCRRVGVRRIAQRLAVHHEGTASQD